MKRFFMFVPIWLLIISGCTQEKDQLQHQLDVILKEVQVYEKEISVYDSQLKDLEKKEQTLFRKTVDLNIEERDALESGVTRLSFLLQEREGLLDKEKEAIASAEETAEQLDDLPAADSNAGNRAVSRLRSALNTRYELHHEVVSTYEGLIDKQKEVYDLLIDENVKRVKLEEAVREVNNQQATLADAVRAFNQSTSEVNSALQKTQEAEKK